MKTNKDGNHIRQGYSLLSYKERWGLVLVLFGAVLLSLIETVGITAVMPFISIASNAKIITSNKYLYAIYQSSGFHSDRIFTIAFGLALIVFYLLRGGYNFLYLKVSTYFALKVKHHIEQKILEKYIVDLSYKEYVDQNSHVLAGNITNFPNMFFFWLQSALLVLSELLILIILYTILLVVNFKMTLVLTIILGAKVLLLTKLTANKLKANGKKMIELSHLVDKSINATFGNFKIVKLVSNQQVIINDFTKKRGIALKIEELNAMLQQLPRILLETVGFSMLIGVVVYILFRSKDLSVLIPTISMYAIALYRMLPSINKILGNYNQMLYTSKAVGLIKEELSRPSLAEGNEDISFKDKIVLNKLNFAYNNSKTVIVNADLTIKKGERVAFIGESGGGKSTLIDLIIGLYQPDCGEIIIDDVILNNDNIKSWRKKIGYIPQSIYLFDGSVADNVSFGSNYDEDKIINCLKKANIYEFLLTKNGIDTKVGQHGIQLSGGQQQRIGIARALYSDPEILVLDEATSALDSETEYEVMNEIYKVCYNKTLLIIAHRLSTVERCDRIIKINNGIISV